MKLKTPLNLLAGAAWLTLSGAGAALAADVARISVYPSPGLYRVVSQSTLQSKQGDKVEMTHQVEQDTVTGNARATITSPGAAPVTVSHAGQGPVNLCIKPLLPSGGIPPATSCKTSAPVVGPGSLSYVSVCAGMNVNITIKKLDDKNWEYTTRYNFGAGDQATQTMVQRYTRIASTCPATSASPAG